MANHDKSETGWDSFERLLQAARNGDRHAMNQIIDECRDYLLLVANQEIDSAIQAKLGASDLVQQSLAEIPSHLAQFRGNSREEFLAWLRQILMNDLQDARRRFKASSRRDVSREQSIFDSKGNERPIADDLLTPSSQAMHDEQAQVLQAAMAQLPPRQQQIIQLRNWSRKSFVEIGQQLEISPDAARKMWYRAIVKLQGLLSAQFDSTVAPRSLSQEPDDD
jgi:RNA polymerase sigma-70 factor (ECF subfamily)